QIALPGLVNVSDPSNVSDQPQLWDLNGTAAGGEVLIHSEGQAAGHAHNVPSGGNVGVGAGASTGTATPGGQPVT
ncbi:hypothetical protein, partial [Bradyrhizobium uaiense]|uniref:hypothetical protein n=1 Tax=Bradyrhizobium uaiense TaxID=2594946 RepID=UPI0013D7942D